jgi:FkbM family methyltransferase
MNSVVFSPADCPENCRLLPISSLSAETTHRLLSAVRPDVGFATEADNPASIDWLLTSGPLFWSDIKEARGNGFTQPVLFFPEHSTSYYDYWTFPIELLSRSIDGGLHVDIRDFTRFVAGWGDFFGRTVDGRHEPEMCRYMPLLRATAKSRELMKQVLASLGDEESRFDYTAVVEAEPQALWRHWLRSLYNGMEYMDYVTLTPGSVVLNCGVHGGGEIPYFLASMADQGTIVNVDPLGLAYLADYVRTALGGSSAEAHEICAALDDLPGSVEMLVEPGGMAQNVNSTQAEHELRTFPTTTIDDIARELALPQLDLIKMDIEGAEPRALAGAWQSIVRFRPQLAISIYHQPEHFFELPFELIRRLRDYRFFIRNYHFISNETIFYAIPIERPYRARNTKIQVSLI